MNSKTLWIIVAIVVVLGLGWWFWSMNNQQEVVPAGDVAGAEEQFTDDSKDGAAASASATATITYSDAGFSPATLTVKEGSAVTFINTSTHEMWIASDEHPTHTGYDSTSKDTHCAPGYTGTKPLDECGVGTSFTFIFAKAGTFGYHNHREDDDHGTVVVTQ